MDYLENPVFTFDIDWTRNPQARFKYDLREMQIGFGPEVFEPLQEDVIRGWQFEVLLQDQTAVAEFDAFFTALGGRLKGFWLPGPERAFEIVAFVGVTTDNVQFDIKAQGLSQTYADHPAQYIYLIRPGEDASAAKITLVQDNGDGTERVTVTPQVGLIDESSTPFPLYYVRLAGDTIEAAVETEGVEVRKLKVIELPPEYATADEGRRPVYLYTFSGELAGELQTWFYTSFAWDLEINGEAYVAAPITHGAISRTTNAEEEIRIEARYEAGHPLALMFPGSLPSPLSLDLFEAEYDPVSGAALIVGQRFSGRVMSVSLSGRKVSAMCSSVIDALGANVPAALFQPHCNYRLFEPNTCRAVKVDFQKAAVVETLNGREVTVSGAALTGIAEHHFAEGWIEVGTGSAFEVRAILDSTAEAAGEVTLTLTEPLRHAEVSDAVTLTPGCDGRSWTCQNKFNNFVNFGGHQAALRNLTLKALDIPLSSAGKK